MAAEKSPSPVMEFVVGMLKKDKHASYADIKTAGEKKSMTIYPIVFGRAKALLGLVPTSPRGQGKRAMAKRVVAKPAMVQRGPGRPPKIQAPARRGPGRPRKEISPLATLDTLVNAMKQSESSRDRYRRALENALAIIRNAL